MRLIWGFCFLFVACASPDASNNLKENTGQINIRLGETINKLNPLLSGTGYAKQVEELLYLSLYQFDPIDLNLKPTLAKGQPKLEVLGPNQLKIGFEIREEAKWSDGKSISAADYLFTFRLIFNPELNTHGYRAYLSFIDKMEVDPKNDRMIWIWTKKKYHLAQTVLSNIELFPEHIHDPKKKLRAYSIDQLRKTEKGNETLKSISDSFKKYGAVGTSEIINSGPYELKEWIPQESITLQKKEDYWAELIEDKPVHLQATTNSLRFNIVRDQQAALQQLKGGGIDIMNQAPLIDFNKEDAEQLQFFSSDQFLYYYIALNPENPILSTPAGRKAVNQSFDIENWIKQQMLGLATAVTNPISPLLPYYNKDLQVIQYNSAKAISYFEKSGFDQLDNDGIRFRMVNDKKERLTLRLAYSSANDLAGTLSVFFKEKAKPIGLEIIPKPMELKPMRKDYGQGKYDMVFLAAASPPADYDPQQSWHTKSWNRGNRVKFGNAQTDQIIDDICSSIDPEERRSLYYKFQEEIHAAQPFIFLYSPKQRVMARKGLKVTPANVWPGYVSQLLE